MSINAADRRSRIVLAVDDESDNISLLQSLIEGAGYSFLAAANGAECLSLVTRITPRLVLLDVQMPDLDGYETCRRLRQMPAFQRVPIVFLTARKTKEDVQRCVQAGGNDFITKPFDPARLVKRVEHWIGRRL